MRKLNLFIFCYIISFLFIIFQNITFSEKICPKIITNGDVPCIINQSGKYIISENIYSKKGIFLFDFYGHNISSLIYIKNVKNVTVDFQNKSIQFKVKNSAELLIYITNSSNITVRNIRINNIGYIVFGKNINNLTIEKVDANNLIGGIDVFNCEYCLFKDIKINDSNYAINIIGNKTKIENSYFVNSDIKLNSFYINISNVKIINSYLYIFSKVRKLTIKNVFINNYPVVDLQNLKNKKIELPKTEIVIILNSKNLEIYNLNLNGNFSTLIIYNSSNLTFKNTTLMNFPFICIEDSKNISFYGNISKLNLHILRNSSNIFIENYPILIIQHKNNLKIKNLKVKKLIIENSKNIELENVEINSYDKPIVIDNSINITLVNFNVITKDRIKIVNSKNITFINLTLNNSSVGIITINTENLLLKNVTVKNVVYPIISDYSSIIIYNSGICGKRNIYLYNSNMLVINSVITRFKLKNSNIIYLFKNYWCNGTSYKTKNLTIQLLNIDKSLIKRKLKNIKIKLNDFPIDLNLENNKLSLQINCVCKTLSLAIYKHQKNYAKIINCNTTDIKQIVSNDSIKFIVNLSNFNNKLFYCNYVFPVYNLTIIVNTPENIFAYPIITINNAYVNILKNISIIKLEYGNYTINIPRFITFDVNNLTLIKVNNVSLINDSIYFLNLTNDTIIVLYYNFTPKKKFYILNIYFFLNGELATYNFSIMLNNITYNITQGFISLNLTKGQYIVKIPNKINNCYFVNWSDDDKNISKKINLIKNIILTANYYCEKTSKNSLSQNALNQTNNISYNYSKNNDILYLILIIAIILSLIILYLYIYKLRK